MSTQFWIRRVIPVFLGAVVVLTGVHALKGYSLPDSIRFGLLWGALSDLVFTGASIYHSRRQHHCVVCIDTPERSATGPESDPDRR